MSRTEQVRDLGAVGVWAPWWLWEQEGEQLAEAAADVEELGFGALWVANGPGMLETAAAVLGATERITVATGIVNIWVHSSEQVAAGYRQAEEEHPGRLLLGLGNGPREAAQWALSPYRELTQYLDRLDAAGVPVERRMLAAVGPRMLELAAARSSGAHPFLSTPEHTAQARVALGSGPLLAPELKVVLESDPGTARAIARQALEFYLSKRGYSGNLRRLGFTDEDLAGGGSDRLVDAVVAWGDVDAVMARIAEHHQAGANHVAVQVLNWQTDDPDRDQRRLPRAQYRQLAEGLASLEPR
ncbi:MULTISPECIES: LLM class F420-dependent oxidoreductase [Kribbella]|uniref:LLM class F420-dependent oxidoreductase n=1 Tax=Kribbella TaxID=182639 RepID=UPI001F543B17|nr:MULTISPECIES: LLM class F420-dependent oxidoreductase [Kribbella]